MTKSTELRKKDVAGLQTEVKELQKAHFGLRMQKATQQLTNLSTLRSTRRSIARAKPGHAVTATAGAARIVQGNAQGRHARQTRLNTSVPLVPPKPKLFFTACSIFISRAVFAQ